MTLKAMTNAVVALVAITLTSLITGAAKVDGQIPENGQNLNASEIDKSTTIEEERTSSASTKEYETGFAQANGITIAYEKLRPQESGDGAFLIAGTGSQLTFWPTQPIDGLVQSGLSGHHLGQSRCRSLN